MATYCELSAALRFNDGRNKTVKFSPYYPSDWAVSDFKSRAMAINTALATEGNTVFDAITIESEDGGKANVSKISSATITATDKTVIFAKTESARITALEMAGDDNG